MELNLFPDEWQHALFLFFFQSGPSSSEEVGAGGSSSQHVPALCSENRIRISVEGFNPSTGPVELYKSLEVLFKTCGEVDDIEMEIDPVTRQLTSTSCVVYLRGEGAEQRAPLLDGSELGGKKLRVTLSPLESTDGLTTAARAARKVAEFQRSRSEAIFIAGYDPSLPQDALKSALRKHFAPCGEITDILIFDSHALVHLYGLGSVQRAIQLDGTDLGGGFNLAVQDVTYQNLEALLVLGIMN